MRTVDRVGGVLVETYRIERLIAEGSMGRVYEARHLRIPKRFAVKFLHLGLQGNIEALQRFRREAEVVATLEHPNIVGLYDYNVGDDGVPYIVLEFLDGEQLAARLVRGKQPLDETLRVVDAVGAALTAAHARNIIHRDLKPENVVLTASGGVKVVDFGVAKLRGAPDLTAVNTIVGTLPYMAPEQLRGAELDARVDQYALATMAYEMLAGEMAFDGSGTVADVARRVLTHQPPFVAGVPQAVNEVVFRGMARAADDRFPSVAEFVAALREASSAREEPALSETHPELPPLAGEATRATLSATLGQPSLDDDEPASPPDDVAPLPPSIAPPLSPWRVTSGELASVRPDETGEHPPASLLSSGEHAPLPALSTVVVDRRSARGGGEPDAPLDRLAERSGLPRAFGELDARIDQGRPRVPARPMPEPPETLKTADAVTAPRGWAALARNSTRSARSWLGWLVLGLLLGMLAGAATLLFLRR
jgi:serine/threonine protein kinase